MKKMKKQKLTVLNIKEKYQNNFKFFKDLKSLWSLIFFVLQWMTAGRGIIHSEMPEEEVNTGLQLWINLSSNEKM